MKQDDFAMAERLHEVLCLPSDCYDENGNLKKFEYVVAIDDDVTSAIYAVRMARQIREIYGFYPTILCVGGKGILSRHLYNKSEAEVLADVCVKLCYPQDLIWTQGLKHGKNTGENIQNVAKVVCASFNHRPSVLFCVTKRQSLRYILTQRKQEPYIDAGWYVIEESMKQACKLMNAKSLCGGEMMVQEVAAILPRCQMYCGKYMEYLPQGSKVFDNAVDIPTMSDARYLARKYCLKLGGKPTYHRDDELFDGLFCYGSGKFRFVDYCRYVRLYVSLLLNKKKIMAAIDDAIRDENFDGTVAE